MTETNGTTRRTALGLGAASIAATVTGGIPVAAAEPPARRAPLRFDDPKWNRDQAARLQAHLDGRQTFGRCSGTVSGVKPGEVVRTLFGFEVLSTIRVVRRPDGNYDRMCKEVVFYTDLETGKVLEEYTNPYTNERVKVVDIANDPYNWVIRDWVGPPALPGFDTHNVPEPVGSAKKPFKLHIKDFNKDTLLVHEGGNGFYKNLLDPAKWVRESAGEMVQVTELFRYFVRRADMENPDLTLLPHNGIWMRITPWLPWMLMGRTPGHVFYEGEFCPNDDLEYFSPAVVARVKAKYPQYLEAPTKWYGPSYSSLEHYALEQKPAPARK